jgi:hypothetical protein
VVDPIQTGLQGIVGINGEVGRNNRQLRTPANFAKQKISNIATGVIVAKAGIVWRHRHFLAQFTKVAWEKRALPLNRRSTYTEDTAYAWSYAGRVFPNNVASS